MSRLYALAGLLVVLPACSTAEGDTDGGSGSTGQSADSAETAMGSAGTTGASATSTSSGVTSQTSTSTTGTSVGTSADPSETASGSTAAETEGCPFVCDVPAGPEDCDLFLQDCPRGEKCTAWANDGGNSWNDTMCVPIERDADAVGEPCTVEGSGVTGFDSCELGAMCWNVDPKTLEGVCIAYCGGSVAEPTCAGACDTCSITSEGVLTICLPGCDPLNPDCGEGEMCVGVNQGFSCVPTIEEQAGLGEPCEGINACEPGLACVSGDAVTGCDGLAGCCTAFCDPGDPNSCDAQPGNACLDAGGEVSARCGGDAGLCATPDE